MEGMTLPFDDEKPDKGKLFKKVLLKLLFYNLTRGDTPSLTARSARATTPLQKMTLDKDGYHYTDKGVN
jgi:hypothetical protein